jgi:hypothetical protein
MELDLQSLFGLMCTAVLIGWDPTFHNSPPPHLGSCTMALLVSQDRRHLFVTPWRSAFGTLLRIRSPIFSPTTVSHPSLYNEFSRQRSSTKSPPPQDLNVFGPPGSRSGSNSTKYGSRSCCGVRSVSLRYGSVPKCHVSARLVILPQHPGLLADWDRARSAGGEARGRRRRTGPHSL